MTAAYVGEKLNLRVVDLGADLTDGSDTVKVLVQAKSGTKHMVELVESGPHTGVFLSRSGPELRRNQRRTTNSRRRRRTRI